MYPHCRQWRSSSKSLIRVPLHFGHTLGGIFWAGGAFTTSTPHSIYVHISYVEAPPGRLVRLGWAAVNGAWSALGS